MQIIRDGPALPWLLWIRLKIQILHPKKSDQFVNQSNQGSKNWPIPTKVLCPQGTVPAKQPAVLRPQMATGSSAIWGERYVPDTLTLLPRHTALQHSKAKIPGGHWKCHYSKGCNGSEMPSLALLTGTVAPVHWCWCLRRPTAWLASAD